MIKLLSGGVCNLPDKNRGNESLVHEEFIKHASFSHTLRACAGLPPFPLNLIALFLFQTQRTRKLATTLLKGSSSLRISVEF